MGKFPRTFQDFTKNFYLEKNWSEITLCGSTICPETAYLREGNERRFIDQVTKRAHSASTTIVRALCVSSSINNLRTTSFSSFTH